MPEFPIAVVELGILHWNGSMFFENCINCLLLENPPPTLLLWEALHKR